MWIDLGFYKSVFNLRVLISGLAAFSCLLIAVFVLRKNSERKQNLYFFLFNLSIFFWNSSDFIGPFFSYSHKIMVIYYRLSYIGAILMIPSFFKLGSYTLEDNESRFERWVFKTTLFFAVFLLGALPTNLFIQNVTYDGTFQEVPGSLYVVFVLYFFIIFSYNLFRLSRKFNSKNLEERNRVRYFSFALIFALTCACSAFFAIWMGYSQMAYIGFYAFEVAYSGMLAYAITKHQLLLIQVVIGKTIAILISAAIFIFGIIIVNYHTQNNVFLNIALLSIICLLFSCFAIPFQTFIITSAKRKFLKGFYEPEKAIEELEEILIGLEEKSEIIKRVSAHVDNVLQVEYIGHLIKESDSTYRWTYQGSESLERIKADQGLVQVVSKQLKICTLKEAFPETDLGPLKNLKFDAKTVLVPFHSPESFEGVIVLGQRSSEKPYEEKDLRLLKIIQSYVNTLFYKLTPYEKIQAEFETTKQQLFDAEIMRIQSDKNLDLVHTIQEYNHEIRTPLQAITTYAEQLPEDTDELRKAKTTILKNVDRANDIVSGTLRITPHHNDMKAVQKRMLSLVRTVEDCLSHYVFANDVTVKTEFKDKASEIYGVPDDIKMVLTNLIKNADEAMPNGGVLNIKSILSETEGVLEISDTGVGIPEEQINKIWEPYRSSHITKGRGLGLSIVHRIVTEHQGRITVVSKVGQGTTFRLGLPKYIDLNVNK